MIHALITRYTIDCIPLLVTKAAKGVYKKTLVYTLSKLIPLQGCNLLIYHKTYTPRRNSNRAKYRNKDNQRPMKTGHLKKVYLLSLNDLFI